MKRICVFCGAHVGGNPAYAETARSLGQALVQRRLGLVFGGGHIGLMGVIADVVLQAGGEVIGVIPQTLVERELAHRGVADMRVVETMHQRKGIMADLADAFVALPGGYGTADELLEILTWAQLGIHAKPVGLLNIGGFFDHLLSWLDRAVADAFIKPKHRQLLLATQNVDELFAALESYQPPRRPDWGLESRSR